MDQKLAFDLQINLLSDLLVKIDLATMAHSLEARSPNLDHPLAELDWRQPDRYRVRRGTPKMILREANLGALPAGVASGHKRWFHIPLSDWLAGDLQTMLRDLMGSPKARMRYFVDVALVAPLLNNSGFANQNKAYLFYALLVVVVVLVIWLEQESKDMV